MDKGLDIDELALVGVAHAALNDRPALLGGFLQDFLRERAEFSGLAAGQRRLDRLLRQGDLRADWHIADTVGEWLLNPRNALVMLGTAAYPELLATIPKPPPVLMVSGDPRYLTLPQVAVVGSRRATQAGRDIAYELARDLTSQGLAITSGLASGIDAAAHRGALDATGITLAVFGCGLAHVYPPTHRALAAEISATGALVSEFPLAARPSRYSFPRRNRIISGLALGSLVVEAALTSGSLITAMQALEQGREVFAVPGSVRNALSQGCHALIKQGAVLTETAADVLRELTGFQGNLPPRPEPAPETLLDPREQGVLAACDFEACHFDRLLERTGLTAPELSSILTALDMKGLVRSEYGGTFVRIAKSRA